MTSYTASTHAIRGVRAAAAALGAPSVLPECFKREVTVRPERSLRDCRLPENSA